MTTQTLSYVIAVVDPMNDFFKRLEVELQDTLSDYEVVGYDSTDQFFHAIEQYPFHVPLLIIADFAARHPTIQEGIFNKACEKVPRARGIYFSLQPDLEDCEQMLRLGVLADIVIRRGTREDIDQLAYSIEKFMNSFKSSVDHWLINHLVEAIGLIPDPENYSVRTDQSTLSLPQALVQMARKTVIGESVLHILLSTNLVQTDKICLPNTKEITLDSDPPWWTKLLLPLRVISTPLSWTCIGGGLVIFVVSCILGFLDIAVLGLGAFLTGIVHIMAKE